MRVGYFSDTHDYHEQVDIPVVDLLICGGDFTGTGTKYQVKSFLNWFKKQPSFYKVLVAGNHDRSFDPEKNVTGGKPKWLLELLEDYRNHGTNYYLESESCEIEDLKIWGSPVTPSFGRHYWAFNKDRGEEIREVWEQIPDNSDIIVTHGPVYGNLDQLIDGQRVGCEDLRDQVAFIRPLLHLSGHIHYGYGYYCSNSGVYVNGAICDEEYNPINKPWIITIENKQVIKIENE